ncbi:MAG TPA: exopolysaccharide biosynthesis polyprenyl glycosylphosphotransferase [Acidocella sp.]|nr:exopolysaccharide biosynthesis polyprenyl glycosylphosphotransferase [Acidocella sp.]HQU03944.1 exopolysaccharide biosynthesis polyprenyl glycosylphosphotransferase [Acidocella sp.]
MPIQRPRFLPHWQLASYALVADFAIVMLAAFLSYLVASGWRGDLPLRYGFVFLGSALLCMVSFAQAGLYRISALRDDIFAVHAILPRWTSIFITLAASAALTHEPGLFSRLWFGLFYIAGFSGLWLTRFTLARQLRSWIKAGYATRTAVIIGDNAATANLLARLQGHSSGIRFLGVFDDATPVLSAAPQNLLRRGNIQNLIQFVRQEKIDLVIITLPVAQHEYLSSILRQLRDEPLNIRVLPGEIGLLRGAPVKLSGDELPGVKLITVADRPMSDMGFFIKSLLDRSFAAAGLILLAPVFVLCAALIKLEGPGPVFFIQPRIGYKGRVFNIMKFRTMNHLACGSQPTRLNDARISRIGYWLRRYSLDELPQVLNVLRGEMSLVGPRPHMVGQQVDGRYFADALDDYAGRHWVKPGMTGWAQVNGWRGPAETIEQIERRVAHDIYYIENWSLTFDLIILVKTIFVGFTGKNVF